MSVEGARPCPFCNAGAHRLVFVAGKVANSECVECTACGARGPWSRIELDDPDNRARVLRLWGEMGKRRFWE